jgi:hypothetical protein
LTVLIFILILSISIVSQSLHLSTIISIPSNTMALNGLAGAGQAKTAILEAKGIYAPASKAQLQLFGGGIFGKVRDKKPPTTTPTTRRSDAMTGGQEKENQVGQSGGAK